MRLCSTPVVRGTAVWLWVASVSVAAADLRLIEAVKDQDHVSVSALLGENVDVNASEEDGATALHWAAVRNDVDVVDELLRAGADVNAANDYGVTAISLACLNRGAGRRYARCDSLGAMIRFRHFLRRNNRIVAPRLSDRSVDEIVDTDAKAALSRLGLHEHLSPQRSNGLAAMVARIKSDAQLEHNVLVRDIV